MPQPVMVHAVIENGMVGAGSSASTQIPNGTGRAAYFRTGSEEALVGSSPIKKQGTAQSTTSARAKSFPGTRSSSGRGSKATKNGARDRTFACTLCSFTFFFKQNRDRHINEVHLGKRPHTCSHPGCKGAFKNLGSLKQHQKTVHEKVRPFKCERCDRSFGQRNHLRQHILVVHDKVKMYACDVCEMTFSILGNRTQHMKRRHADRPEAPAAERSGS